MFHLMTTRGMVEGLKSKQSAISMEKRKQQLFADDLKLFSCRFDIQDFSK